MTKIVLADDEADVLDSTSMVLRMKGYRVTPVQDSTQILSTLKRVRPRVLLQDVYMPGLKLDNLVRAIRREPALRALQILIFTASANAEDACRRVGADGFVKKPFDADTIKSTLERFIIERRGR